MVKKYLKKSIEFWENNFLESPENLWALRISFSAILALGIFYLLGIPKAGLTVSMGIVATALTENDVHIKSSLRSTLLIGFLFFIFSSLVQLLLPYPIIFGVFLVSSSFFIMLAGELKSKYNHLAFGSVLIILYSIFIYQPEADWFRIPFLFVVAVIIHMATSIVILLLNPYQNLQNELANAYQLLAKYLRMKSKFFPSSADEQEEIRNELALINIQLFSQSEKIKNILQRLGQELNLHQRTKFNQYVSEWNQLQLLHERAVSSHESYDSISQNVNSSLVVAGLGKMLRELGKASDEYARNILKKNTFQSSPNLRWTSNALELLLRQNLCKDQASINYLWKNIKSMEETFEARHTPANINLEYTFDEKKWRDLFSPKNNKFRHAVRLSTCFAVGYTLMNVFKIEQGAWIILTSLIVCQQTYDATRQRFFKRIIGTLMGVIIGITLSLLLPTTAGQVVILIASMFIFFKYLRGNYIIAAIFITVYVLAVYNLLQGTGVQVMTPRIIDTLIGSVIAYLSIRFIWPEWQYKNLKNLLIKAIEKDKIYFESVMNQQISTQEYLHHQRNAHRADNQLAQVWKSMRFEPKSKQKLITPARNFTYLNHTLLSYISALGVHRKSLNFNENDFFIKNQIIKLLDEILLRLQLGNQNSESTETSFILPIEKLKDTENLLFLDNILKLSQELKEAGEHIEF